MVLVTDFSSIVEIPESVFKCTFESANQNALSDSELNALSCGMNDFGPIDTTNLLVEIRQKVSEIYFEFRHSKFN